MSSFRFLLILISLFISFSGTASCYDPSVNNKSFFERISPALNMRGITERQIYINFRGDIVKLNNLIKTGQTSGTEYSKREPVYLNFYEAKKSASSITTYIIGIDQYKGNVFEVSTLDGRRLALVIPKGSCSSIWER